MPHNDQRLEAAAETPGSDIVQVALQSWAAPEAVIVGERCTLKLGAKASGGSDLGGATIEVCDEAGAIVASAQLQTTPWPQTDALYWVEVSLTAPRDEGACAWSARIRLANDELHCESTPCEIRLNAIAPPAHALRVRVTEKLTARPVADAIVRVGAFRAATDGEGRAELRVPAGAQDLIIWKAGFDAPVTSLDVGNDKDIFVEVSSIPEEHPDAAWKM